MTITHKTDKKVTSSPEKSVKAPKRESTSYWLDPQVSLSFKDACHLAQRKTCDVLEPLMRAFIEVINKTLNDPSILNCPFTISDINVHIETIKLETLYETRGRKPNTNLVFCEKSGKYGTKSYCLHTCMFGGNSKNPPSNPCKTYLELDHTRIR
mgnify:CR=1 FL=1|jgi:hypothetical protein